MDLFEALKERRSVRAYKDEQNMKHLVKKDM